MVLVILESFTEGIILEADNGAALLLSTDNSTLDGIGLTECAVFDVTESITEGNTLGDNGTLIDFTFNGSALGGLDSIELVIIEHVTKVNKL